MSRSTGIASLGGAWHSGNSYARVAPIGGNVLEGDVLSTMKDELVTVMERSVSVRKAEVVALLRLAGGLRVVANTVVIDAEIDHEGTARRLCRALHELYGSTPVLHVMRSEKSGRDAYLIRVARHAQELARQTGLIDRRGRPVLGMPAHVVAGSVTEVEGAWRGAVLASGMLSSRGQRHGLTVRCPGPEVALALGGAARRLGVSAKARQIRGQECIVVAGEEAVNDLLRRIGAPRAGASWISEKSRRLRAQPNSGANFRFESANTKRSVMAAAATTTRVKRALEILGDTAPEHLAEAGRLRMTHPEAALGELGRLADPPMSKDAVAGRIRRLLAVADRLAQRAGIPDTGSAA